MNTKSQSQLQSQSQSQPHHCVTALLYEHDYQQWLEETIQLLHDRSFDLLDLENLIEELEDMGKGSRREVFNRLVVLLIHLLKWKYQPEKQSNSWLSTINEQRRQLFILFKDSPSLQKNYLPTIFSEAYPMASKLASKETNLPLSTFPKTCPFTETQIFDFDFFP
jgi:Domain of unknown function DUF29